MSGPAQTLEQVLAARVKVATWLGEHGREDTRFAPLVEAVDLLDDALRPTLVAPPTAGAEVSS